MERLNILLLKPYSKADELIPPFSLGYLATAVRGNHNIEIIDGIKEKLTSEKLAKILEEKQYQLIGIQIFTFQVVAIRDYLKTIKKVLPGARIVLGGPHVSASPEDIFDILPDIDWAFKGEAEVGFKKLADLIAENRIGPDNLRLVPGLIWQDSGQTMINEPICLENLDELSIPSWDLIRPDEYPLAPHGGFFKNYPIAPIITTRGCPYLCSYCGGHLVSGRKIRFRSVAKIIEEISLLYHKYRIREIHIEDDNFTFNHDFVKEFCRELKRNNLNISWTCPNGVRLDSLNEDLLLIMKAAGLYSISVGVESGSERVLKEMKKNLNKDTIREKIKLIRKCGLDVSGFFIIGYPTETKADIEETINFALSLDLKRAGFSLFKPFPGTDITRNLVAHGELKEIADGDWEKFVLADAIFAPPGLSLSEMKKLRRKALLKFYLRPKIIFRFVLEIKNWQHLKLIIKRIYSWIFKAK